MNDLSLSLSLPPSLSLPLSLPLFACQAMFGQFTVLVFDNVQGGAVGKVLMISFVMLVDIMLLNLLIAILSSTYERLHEVLQEHSAQPATERVVLLFLLP